MDVALIALLVSIVVLLLVVAIVLVIKKPSSNESSVALQAVSQRIDSMRAAIDSLRSEYESGEKITEVHHQEILRILSLIGTQLQQVAAIVYRNSASTHINVKTGDTSENTNVGDNANIDALQTGKHASNER